MLTDKKKDKTIIRKQEHRAKKWAIQELLPLEKLIEAFEMGYSTPYDMAEYLNVTQEFLLDAFKKYANIYGTYTTVGDNIIFFDPPGIWKMM